MDEMVKIEERQIQTESNEERLTRLAAEINIIKEQTRAVVYNATLEIGKRLVLAKGAVGHGNWGRWLAEHVDYKERTAQSIIAMYERFGDGQQKLFGKMPDAEQVAKLNRSQMLALMSIKDEEECFDFMEEHKDDLQDMSKRELETAIKAMKEAQNGEAEANTRAEEAKAEAKRYHERVAELEARLKETDASELEALKEKYAKLQEGMKEAEKQLTSADKLAEKLAGEIDDANALAESYRKEYENAQNAAVESQKSKEEEICRLKNELEAQKQKPIEAAIVEKVPESMIKEMKLLREKIASIEGKKDKTEQQFIRHYENLRSELEESINLLAGMDAERKQKYATKCIGMLEISTEMLKEIKEG